MIRFYDQILWSGLRISMMPFCAYRILISNLSPLKSFVESDVAPSFRVIIFKWSLKRTFMKELLNQKNILLFMNLCCKHLHKYISSKVYSFIMTPTSGPLTLSYSALLRHCDPRNGDIIQAKTITLTMSECESVRLWVWLCESVRVW